MRGFLLLFLCQLVYAWTVSASDVTCNPGQNSIDVKLFKSDANENGWNGAYFEIHDIDHVVRSIHRDSFHGHGLVDNVHHCLPTSKHYLVSVHKSGTAKAQDIGLELCNQAFVAPGQIVNFYINERGECLIENNVPKPQAEKLAHLSGVSGAKTLATSYSFSFFPTADPTVSPTFAPTFTPTFAPSFEPTFAPTFAPSFTPTLDPTSEPTRVPTLQPTSRPSLNPTAAPSVRPTPGPGQPTFRPTLSPTPPPPSIVQIAAVQTIQGVTAAQWNDATESVFVSTVAVTLNVATSSVDVVSVADAVSNVVAHMRKLTAAGVSVQYVVQAIAQDLGFTNAQAAYGNLTATLTTAVNSGQFTTTMQTIATTNNVPVLQNATSAAIETFNLSPTMFPTSAPNSSNDDKLSDGDIAAIVICSFIGFCGLIGLFFYSISDRSHAYHDQTGKNSSGVVGRSSNDAILSGSPASEAGKVRKADTVPRGNKDVLEKDENIYL